MRIVEIRDIVAPISSAIANAYIDFSAMNTSMVAIVTDRIEAKRALYEVMKPLKPA
jgi:D(-)-tartrate dehydratase